MSAHAATHHRLSAIRSCRSRSRIDDLLSRLTLDEEMGSLHQFTPPSSAWASRPHRQEALHGVAWMGPAIVFPQPVGLGALGATWNTDRVRRVGEAVQRDGP